MSSTFLFLVLLNEMRRLGKSYALLFLFLFLIKGMGWVCLEATTGGVLQKRILQYLQENTCVAVFYNNVSGFVKMRLHHGAFVVNVVKSSRASILKDICKWLLQ